LLGALSVNHPGSVHGIPLLGFVRRHRIYLPSRRFGFLLCATCIVIACLMTCLILCHTAKSFRDQEIPNSIYVIYNSLFNITEVIEVGEFLAGFNSLSTEHYTFWNAPVSSYFIYVSSTGVERPGLVTNYGVHFIQAHLCPTTSDFLLGGWIMSQIIIIIIITEFIVVPKSTGSDQRHFTYCWRISVVGNGQRDRI
jgi:hypothetical protein